MKRFFIILCFIGVSFAIGYGIGIGLEHLTGDISIGGWEMVGLLVCGVVAVVLAFIVHTFIHEFGHMLFGLLTGYSFLSFRLFNVVLQREDDGFHWKRFNINGTVGQCLMIPPGEEQPPYFWYNVGGVLMNLLKVVGCIVALCLFPLSQWMTVLCMGFIVIGLWMIILNGIPMVVSGLPNDGKNILILWRHPEQRRYFGAMLSVVGEQSRGRRLKEMPWEWFHSEPVTPASSVIQLSARNLYYCHLMDELRLDEAREVAEEIGKIGDRLPMLFRMEINCDRLLLELATLNRCEVVGHLWNERLQQYVKAARKYAPLKCAVLFAYEYINNQNPEAAAPYYEEVKTRQNDYAQPGEALTALAVMDYIKGCSINY